MTAMKVSKSLERVGDESVSISKRALKIANAVPLKDYFKIPEMAQRTKEILQESTEVFLSLDEEKALKIPSKDKAIDDLNRDNFVAIEAFLKNHAECMVSGMELLFISKSLERIADHAVNISSAVIFLIDAEDIRHTAKTNRSN